MAAAAAGSSTATFAALPATRSFGDKAAAGGGGGGGAGADCGVCAICLDKIALQETALVKGCDHAYCVTCILRWASYKQSPLCPQCKHPFEFLSVHRSLDGCIHDYLFDESVCLLLRATWFEPLVVVPHVEVLEEEEREIYRSYQYDDGDEDDLYEDYMSRSPSIRIGNRRWGDNGYVRGGRREARPVSAALPDAPVPSRTPKKKEASASGSGSVSKDVAGRRARRAQKREAADKAAAEKHLKHLQRLGRGKTPEARPEAEALAEALEESPLEEAKALPEAPLEVGPQAI